MTNVLAKALRELADAAETKEVEKEETKKPRTFYAIYAESTPYPYGPNGGYITDPKGIEEYYKLYPTARPRPWSLKTAQAPRYLVENTGEKAREEVEKAIAGLEIIEKGATTGSNNGYRVKYHVVTITEGIA